MVKSDLVLNEIKHLTSKLYGENGFEGDIPHIKKKLTGVDEKLGDVCDEISEHKVAVAKEINAYKLESSEKTTVLYARQKLIMWIGAVICTGLVGTIIALAVDVLKTLNAVH